MIVNPYIWMRSQDHVLAWKIQVRTHLNGKQRKKITAQGVSDRKIQPDVEEVAGKITNKKKTAVCHILIVKETRRKKWSLVPNAKKAKQKLQMTDTNPHMLPPW